MPAKVFRMAQERLEFNTWGFSPKWFLLFSVCDDWFRTYRLL